MFVVLIQNLIVSIFDSGIQISLAVVNYFQKKAINVNSSLNVATLIQSLRVVNT